MNYKQTTQVPNKVLDVFLPTLTGVEFKILMIIIRQTHGFRKERDRMNYTQLIQKSGYSRRVIADTIQVLINKELITVTDYRNNTLHTPKLRKGKTSIYFSSCFFKHADNSKKIGTLKHKDVQKPLHNKTNNTKLKRQNTLFNQGTKRISDAQRIQQILQQKHQS